MEVGREIFWNVGQAARWISYGLTVVLFIVFIYGLKKRFGMWKMGKSTPFAFTQHLWSRIVYFIKSGVFHKTLLRRRESYPGTMHLFIFWGFLLLAVGTGLIAFEDDFFRPLFHFTYLHGNFYLIFSFALEVAGLAALVGTLMALIRRIVWRPDRLDNKPDDFVVLVWILVVLVSGYVVEAVRIANDRPPFEVWSFVGWAISPLFLNLSKQGIHISHAVLYYFHMLLSFGLMGYVVYSRLLHLITSSFNMMFRGVGDGPRGVPALIPDFETAEEFGVNQIDGFTWRQIFDLDACTRCGRCQDRCPAHLTQKPLSPKKLIQDLKGEWLRAAEGIKNEEGLLGKVIEEETVWACTTCLACQVNCPVSIPTVDKTIELRRYLSLTLSKISPELKLLYKNLQTVSNPYGFGKAQRLDWTNGLGIKKASEGPIDVLFWVGCVGSLDDRNQKVAKALVKIMQACGIQFGILGSEEGCCGEPARRTGNEYLFSTLVENNIGILKKANVKKILTMCPHCFHTLKHEYPQFGGNFEVVHTTQFLDDLLSQGKLKLEKPIDKKITYHDSCYLGRGNDLYEIPRRIIQSIPGLKLVEMEWRKDQSFCCGAGGGRMWMEEHIGTRINQMRTDQVIQTNAPLVGTACPYCLTMLSDGIVEKGQGDHISALDLIELVVQSMGTPPEKG